ncbi:zinc-binding dehydrogenase domain-containing protein [Sarocladium implicatum]|nr:zinc-binding dehydrogenase domain-containing protein [Sarocladium implicatum]
MEPPAAMRTVRQLDPSSTKLTLETTSPLPSTDAEYNHLVKVKATSLCFKELAWALDWPDRVTDSVPGHEASGVVVQAPDNSPFPPGTEVYFHQYLGDTGTSVPGSLREYTVVRQQALAKKPKTLSWEEAAAVPLSALTAWQGLFEHGILDRRAITERDPGAIRNNSKAHILITGASGSVGLWLIKLASAAGAGHIVALCHPDKDKVVRDHGAHEVIPYTTQSVAEWMQASRPVDLIIDTVGGETLDSAWDAINFGGTILTIADKGEVKRPERVKKEVAKAKWFLVSGRGSDLAEIGKLVEAGKVKPRVDSVYAFEDYPAAFERVYSRRTAGKVVIKVSD